MISPLGSRYGIQGALGRSVKRASTSVPTVFYPTADTYLTSSGSYDTYNFGATELWLALNYSQSTYYSSWLYKFDLSLASGKTVTGATLTLTAMYGGAKNYARAIAFYGISSANGDWVEGTKDAQIAGSGEPCWDAKEADGSGGVTTAWAGSAGCATSGTDYSATSIGGVADVDYNNSDYTAYDAVFNSTGIALVQSWIDSPQTNYGIVCPNRSNWYPPIYGREVSNDLYKPTLTLTYS